MCLPDSLVFASIYSVLINVTPYQFFLYPIRGVMHSVVIDTAESDSAVSLRGEDVGEHS